MIMMSMLKMTIHLHQVEAGGVGTFKNFWVLASGWMRMMMTMMVIVMIMIIIIMIIMMMVIMVIMMIINYHDDGPWTKTWVQQWR